MKRRVLIVTGLIWLPLLVLCAIEGTLTRGVDIPFVSDIETHARFLLTVPLMILGELVVHERLRDIIFQFVNRKLVPDNAMETFRAAIRSSMVWRNSIAVEAAFAVLVLSAGYYIRTELLALNTSTWYAHITPAGAKLTLAGVWFSWVSNPIMQFLMVRWVFRMVVWARLLWHISRIQLDLIPTHPDRNAGLGFLSLIAFAYTPLLTAFGATVAGLVASRIIHEGAALADFKVEIVALVVIGFLLVLGPMLVFAPQILKTKRKGLAEYGTFAVDFTRSFDREWLRTAHADVLHAADIQSLADLSNAFGVIKEIRPVPITRDTLIQLTLATLAPFIPLVFTVIPPDELLKRILATVM
jgi:hypothetical protein